MKSVAIKLAVALGLIAGVATAIAADRWPADVWERLDREHF